MKIDSLKKLYVHELKDLYSAENQILEVLPRMAEAADNADLKKAFQDHEKETRTHVKRLETIFQGLDFEPGGHKCEGMEGLLKEGKSLLNGGLPDDVLDAAMIGAAQRVEHYEMAGYGTARALARQLGEHEAVELLTQTLEEEGKADRALTHLAEKSLNFEAMVGA
jgi:ferritin-like metal-binding protein YciE